MPRVKLGDLLLDRFEHAAAAAQFEIALELDPSRDDLRLRLARCLNVLERHGEAQAALTPYQAPHYERGLAFVRQGALDAAEREFRAVLGVDPWHRRALKELCSRLRKSGRLAELLTTCEALHARAVDHAQLFYEWGRGLALAGDEAGARALLFDPARVSEIALPVPEGFADQAGFNAALAEEILVNPNILSAFPIEEANRGSARVHSLFSGPRPAPIRGLLATIEAVVSAYRPAPLGDFDPWVHARPAEAHLRPWGLIQRGGAYEEWHSHRGGWLSGVYYVRVPAQVSTAGDGPGCIEFGPPPSLFEAMPDLIPRRRYLPREGKLLLAPSHYAHRTIPSGADEYRISFAFDVVAHG